MNTLPKKGYLKVSLKGTYYICFYAEKKNPWMIYNYPLKLREKYSIILKLSVLNGFSKDFSF